MANSRSRRRKDHTRRTNTIRVAAIMPRSTDHRSPKLTLRILRQRRANIRSTLLHDRNTLLAELDSGAVYKKLPVDFTALFAIVMRDALEFCFAFLYHLG